MPRTKTVATILPKTIRAIHGYAAEKRLTKSDIKKGMAQMVDAGVDVFRLNMSYRDDMGDSFIISVFEVLKSSRKKWAKDVAVLADLQGPKDRLGELRSPPTPKEEKEERLVVLAKQQEFKLFYKPDRRRNVTHATVGDSSRATVLLQERLYSGFGDLVRRGFATQAGGVEINTGDGETVLNVSSKSDIKPTYILTTVKAGGELESGRGVMPRRVEIELDAITHKDKRDLEFLLAHGDEFLAYIALSFVKSPRDILELRNLIDQSRSFKKKLTKRVNQLSKGSQSSKPRRKILKHTLAPGIIAKIETVQAAEEETLDQILDVADGMMVARGDLGLQIEFRDVPSKQKEIIRRCRLRGKPVITATQMLGSMTKQEIPTRSEVNDVFNAVLDGTDATMLSGETAGGAYPLQAINTMRNIQESAEIFLAKQRREPITEWGQTNKDLADIVSKAKKRLRRMADWYILGKQRLRSAKLREITDQVYIDKLDKTANQPVTDKICLSDWALAQAPEICAIACATTSGRTARMLARYRPEIPIFGVTHDEENRKKLILVYGVHAVNIGAIARTTEELLDDCLKELKKQRYFQKPERESVKSKNGSAAHDSVELVVMVTGTPQREPGTTNQMRLVNITQKGLKLRK